MEPSIQRQVTKTPLIRFSFNTGPELSILIVSVKFPSIASSEATAKLSLENADAELFILQTSDTVPGRNDYYLSIEQYYVLWVLFLVE